MINSKVIGLVSTLVVGILSCSSVSAQVEQIWLTHRSNDPSKLVVSWTTKTAGDSVVRYGTTPGERQEVRVDGNRTLHHVEIPLLQKDATYHYTVATGDEESAEASFKAYPTDGLRVAVAADWQNRPKLDAMLQDDPHLLLTAGDHIDSLHKLCGVGVKDCIKPYSELIGTYPELFRSVPFMPAQGNHDREIRPRGSQPPEEPVYDIEATAFRKFFALPDDQWKWYFDVPEFDVRFIALDFHHISDMGTTWQTCQPFDEDSAQYQWYKKLMEQPAPFTVTLYNERNASIRNQLNGQWHQLFRKGTACITGFGHFAERAELDGLLYFNTSLNGRGNRYPDPYSKFIESEDNYLLLTFDRAEKTMTVEIKDLEGKVLDSAVVPRHE